jgi:hypothetical protein
MRGTLSLCQRSSQLLLRGRRRATKETYTLIPSISYCTNIDNNTIDGPQSPRVKIFDRELKRKQVKIQSFSVNLWFEHFGIFVFVFFACFQIRYCISASGYWSNCGVAAAWPSCVVDEAKWSFCGCCCWQFVGSLGGSN